MSDNVDPPVHVLYGVWVPTKGWASRPADWYPYRKNRPRFFASHAYAKRLAKVKGGQLIAFDVVPTLRSWPSLEADAKG
jgi:hypothetical protein